MMALENEVIGGLLVAGSAAVICLSLLPKRVVTGFAGFREELVQQPQQTTTRQRDGARAYDFWHYPLIDLTPDVDGSYVVNWRYVNRLDGVQAYDSGGIGNVFSGLVGGVTRRLELRDTRPGNPGGVPGPRDTLRGEAIAYGDPEGLFDGVWHRFTSNVSVTVSSPSGAVVSTSGLLDEFFRSTVLAVAFAGFNVRTT